MNNRVYYIERSIVKNGNGFISAEKLAWKRISGPFEDYDTANTARYAMQSDDSEYYYRVKDYSDRKLVPRSRTIMEFAGEYDSVSELMDDIQNKIKEEVEHIHRIYPESLIYHNKSKFAFDNDEPYTTILKYLYYRYETDNEYALRKDYENTETNHEKAMLHNLIKKYPCHAAEALKKVEYEGA